jgi:hypothetical protein
MMRGKGGGSVTPDVTPDTAFEILTTDRRRAILRYLRTTDDNVVSHDDLIDHVVEQDIGGNDRERVAVDLRHISLPKLEEVGLIEYDTRSETVRYRGHPLVDCLLNQVAIFQSGE